MVGQMRADQKDHSHQKGQIVVWMCRFHTLYATEMMVDSRKERW